MTEAHTPKPKRINWVQVLAGAALAVVGLVPAAFKAIELFWFLTRVPSGQWMKGEEAAAMPVSIVVLIFAGLVGAWGVRKVIRELKA